MGDQPGRSAALAEGGRDEARPVIGFVGLGNIGSAMARRLVMTTGSLTVWNRSPDKAAALAEHGAVVAASPEAVFDSCDVIGICVTSHVASGEIARRMFAQASGSSRRRVLVDLSTGSPEAAVDLAREADAHGIGWVDSPVSGGTVGAEQGELTLFVGGAAADIEGAAPLLDALSARKTIVGGPGAGQTMKLCNQMIVASNIMAIAETISAARRSGISVAALPDALFGGFADSPPLRILGPTMVERDPEFEFGAVGLMEKDLLLARAMMRDAGAWTPNLDTCIELCARIDGSADISRLVDVFDSDA